MARPRKKKEAPKRKKAKTKARAQGKPVPKTKVLAKKVAPKKVARRPSKATPRKKVSKVAEVKTKPTKKAKAKAKKPTRTEQLVAEIKKLKGQKRKLEAKRKKDRERYEQAKADLAKTKAGAKRLEAQEERKKERKKKREEKTPAAAEVRTHKAKIGKTTHVSATEVDGEPQYIWKELEEKTEDKLVRTKKGKTRRWARLVVELSKESLLFPDQYRRLRGKAVIRTNWHPAHELVGKAADVMDKLQKSGAVVPRAKVVIVESNKKPPKRVF